MLGSLHSCSVTYLELFPHSSPVHLPFMATQVPILEMRKPTHRQKAIELG